MGEEQISSIGRGLCILLGISAQDTQRDADYMWVCLLRTFNTRKWTLRAFKVTVSTFLLSLSNMLGHTDKSSVINWWMAFYLLFWKCVSTRFSDTMTEGKRLRYVVGNKWRLHLNLSTRELWPDYFSDGRLNPYVCLNSLLHKLNPLAKKKKSSLVLMWKN